MNNQNELTKKIKQKTQLIFSKNIHPLTNNKIKFSLKNYTTIFMPKTIFSK